MKRIALTAVAVLACSTAAHAEIGIPGGFGNVNYSWTADNTTPSLGDIVTLTLTADIDPQQSPFYALAAASFDVVIDDPVLLGASVDNSSPGLGLAPDFAAFGSNGVAAGDDVLGVIAGQFLLMGSPVNQGTSLDLMTIELTINDDAARNITVDVNPSSFVAYTDMTGTSQMPYGSTSTPLTLAVQQVPAPGCLALLSAAGLIGSRRRRRAA